MSRRYSITQQLRAERARNPAHKLSQKIGAFYASHAVSPWQKERVTEIRNMCDEKIAGLAAAHDIAAARVFEEYMEFELEYLETSDRLKKENGGVEPTRGLFAGALRWFGNLFPTASHG